MNTQPLWRHPLATHAVAGLIFGFGVGTGGTANVHYINQRFGYEIIRGPAQVSGELEPTNQIAIDLDLIRSALRIGVSAVGSLFNVTRQSVYLWMRGENPGPDRAERIAQLSEALAPHEALLRAQVGRAGRRRLDSGKTVVEALAYGVDPHTVVNELVSKVVSENARRSHFADRIRQRPRMNRGAADNETSV